MLTLRGIELVPARLLVRDVDLPLDVDQHAFVAAAFDRITDFERPPFGRGVVVDEDLESRCLAFDASLRIFEIRHQHRRDAVCLVAGIAHLVAGLRQAGWRFRRQIEFGVAVAEAGNADAGMDLVGRHVHLP